MTGPGNPTDVSAAQASARQARLRIRVGETGAALSRLDDVSPGAAETLLALIRVVADEASRTPRFAKALTEALNVSGAQAPAAPTAPAPARPATSTPATKAPARRSKRAPGVLDPFAVYRDHGEAGLRERLVPLGVDQLKDIIAEHAMDYDKLAMRWRTPAKLHDRIVERVRALTTKGDAFR